MPNNATKLRLICLNLFGGTLMEPLLTFLKNEAGRTNIFCFQEVVKTTTGGEADIQEQLLKILPEFTPHFSLMLADISKQDINNMRHIDVRGASMSSAIFTRRDINILRHSSTPVARSQAVTHTIACVESETNGKKLTIANLHGIADWPKTDTPARMEQSHDTRAVLDAIDGPKILCGDFNLRPDTESLAMLKKGMISLTDEYRIETTRSRLQKYEDRVSDYIIISPEIKVLDFQVPDILISDHLPLILDFEI